MVDKHGYERVEEFQWNPVRRTYKFIYAVFLRRRYRYYIYKVRVARDDVIDGRGRGRDRDGGCGVGGRLFQASLSRVVGVLPQLWHADVVVGGLLDAIQRVQRPHEHSSHHLSCFGGLSLRHQ
jgi:hypothetical protein